MINIAINKKIGGFKLSAKAVKRLAELDGKECFFVIQTYNNDYSQVGLEELDDCSRFYAYSDSSMALDKKISVRDYTRDDPKLIQVIKELGDEVNTSRSTIKVVEIPDGVKWYIDEEDDGTEVVHEEARSWS